MTMDTYGHLFPRGDDRAELAAAEAEAAQSGAEEAARLAKLRRSMDEVEEEERRVRLEDIKRRVAEAKRWRGQQQQSAADEYGRSHKRVKTVEIGVEQEAEDDTDLMTELDGMFTWQRQ